MSRLRALLRRLLMISHGRTFDAQLDEEMKFHFDMRVEKNLRSGMSPADAHVAACRSFGNPSRLKEDSWETWTFPSLETALADLRLAWRRLARNRGLTLVIGSLLTLSIGANTAIFSLADHVIFRSLPVRSPAELVGFATSLPNHPRSEFYSYPYYEALQARDDIFSEVYAISTTRFRFFHRNETIHFVADLVSEDYFPGLGVSAHLGRTLQSSDYGPGARNVVVLSYSTWQQRFGGDPNILNHEVQVEDQPFTVVGVGEEDFRGTRVGTPIDGWIPLSKIEALGAGPPGFRGNPLFANLFLLARLQPRVERSEATVAATLVFRNVSEDAVAGRLLRDRSFTPKAAQEYLARRVDVLPAAKGLSFVRDYNRTRLLIFLASVVLVHLLACVNIAGLLMVRGERQSKETAIRMAIGAGRSRIVRQHLVEGVMITVAGAAGGFLLASALVEAITRMLLPGVSVEIGLDSRVVLFALGLSAFTTLLFSLYPAMDASRIRLMSALKQENSQGNGARRFGLRRVVVVSQVAISVILLIAAGLFLRTLTNLYSLDLGYDPHHLLQVSLDPGNAGYDPPRAFAFWQELERDVRAHPNVAGASVGMLGLVKDRTRLGLPNVNVSPDIGAQTAEEVLNINFDLAGSRYFDTAQMPVLAGRDFQYGDFLGESKVVVINRTAARSLFADRNPVGKRISLAGARSFDIEIVGVVEDAKLGDLREESIPLLWFPYTQSPIPQRARIQPMTLLIRTVTAPEQFARTVRSEIARIAPSLPVDRIETTTSRIDDHLRPERSLATILTAFAVAALILTSLGLFGLVSHNVTVRMREIGIRISLGARSRDIIFLVLGRAIRFVLLGFIIGSGASVALIRPVQAQLFGVQPTEPRVFALIVLVLLIVVVAAIFPPVSRALRSEPLTSLRHE